MGRFFKKDNRRSQEVNIGGETFILKEPSAYDRMTYLNKLDDLISKNEDNRVKMGLGSVEINAYLIAACLVDHFPDLTIDQIWENAKSDLTDPHYEALVPIAEDLSNLKFKEAEDSGTETLPEG